MTLRQTTSFPETAVTHLAVSVDQPPCAPRFMCVGRPGAAGWPSASTAAAGPAVVCRGRLRRDRSRMAGWRSRRGDAADDAPRRAAARRDRRRRLPLRSDRARRTTGQQGLAPGNQIIVNERESGSMLKADVEIPVLAGDVPALRSGSVRIRTTPLTFRTVGVGRPRDVELAPYYRLETRPQRLDDPAGEGRVHGRRRSR